MIEFTLYSSFIEKYTDTPMLADNLIEVVYSPQAREVVNYFVKVEELPFAESAGDGQVDIETVLQQSGVLTQFPELLMNALHLGVWGRKATLNTLVCAGDRIEIYRPLKTDPKESRRLRYKKQGPVVSRHRPGYKKTV